MQCKVCLSVCEHRTFRTREMMFGSREEFTYLQCSECQSLYISEVPPDMGKYYPEDYYSYSEESPVHSSFPVPDWCLSLLGGSVLKLSEVVGPGVGSPAWEMAQMRKVIDFYFKGMPVTSDSRILDVGCGSGTFLRSLSKIGFRNLAGLDLFIKGDMEACEGVPITKGTIFDLDPETKWDLLIFNHSFEHMDDPGETLRAAASRLTAGGLCFIRMPTVSSYAWDHYGVNWVNLEAPRHLFLQSLKSLEILGCRAGLRLHQTVYDSTFMQFWGSEQYMRDIALYSDRSLIVNHSRSIFSLSQVLGFERQAQALNRNRQGDTAAFYLTRN